MFKKVFLWKKIKTKSVSASWLRRRSSLSSRGIKKTTIRQIVEKSGVLTGSIYYFFKNKEDIFQSLVMELLRQCTDLIAAHFRQESPAFRYAALCLVEFEAVAMNQLRPRNLL